MTSSPRRPRLLLVGAGHTHLYVLRRAAMAPLPAQATLVSPDSYALYSGMVPGVLAGLYDTDAARIDVRALAARVGIRFIEDRAVRIDAAERQVHCSVVPPLSYDVLSVDIGARPRGVPEPVSPLVLPVRPIEAALEGLRAFVAGAREGRLAGRLVVVGGGAAGVELAWAARARLAGIGGATVAVVDRENGPLASRGGRVSSKMRQHLERRGVRFLGGAAVTGVADSGVVLEDGRHIDADLVVWASGAEALPIFRESALPTDEHGFLLVADTLQSAGDPAVFASGDCAAMIEHPALPKAGVYAVRQGPTLWRNLRAVLSGQGKLRPYRPQRHVLSLLSTGDRRAVGTYRGLVASGRWVFRVKDWIDRRFVALHASPRPEQFWAPWEEAVSPAGLSMGGGPSVLPCGGCAAKVGSASLSRVLARLDLPPDPRVVVGLDARDDAAAVTHPPGMHVVSTVDFFPPFLDDSFLVGEVAAVNAASDLYAVGAEPRAAMAVVVVPPASVAETEETLGLLLQGAARKLAEMEIALVGGHTVEGKELLFGLAITGACAPDGLLRKAGAHVGDHLVLTKPLGTGVVLAAARAGAVPAAWTEAALHWMLRPNRAAAAALRAAGVRACTDVSGFGLAGHLLEILEASGLGARIDVSALPILPGSLELLRLGVRSSAHEKNSAVRSSMRLGAVAAGGPRVEILFDPQTSGGLLAAVPPEGLDNLRAALRAGGDGCQVIGTLEGGRSEIVLESVARQA